MRGSSHCRRLVYQHAKGWNAHREHVLCRGRCAVEYTSNPYLKIAGALVMFSWAEPALNPSIIKTGTRQRAAHEVPLLTAMANWVIDMDVVATSTSSSTPAAIDKSPMDFSNEDATLQITNQEKVRSQISAGTAQEVSPVGETTTSGFVHETNLEREVSGMGAQENKERRKRDRSDTEANAPPKVLRTDHASVRPTPNTRSGKS
ncbi:hypothetical protein Tco_1355328 [Tanacetum coccineum]